MKKIEKPKSKYLLNVKGKRFKANTLLELMWKFIRNKNN